MISFSRRKKKQIASILWTIKKVITRFEQASCSLATSCQNIIQNQSITQDQSASFQPLPSQFSNLHKNTLAISYSLSDLTLIQLYKHRQFYQMGCVQNTLTLYYHPSSAPCRAVLVLLAIANIKYQGKFVDIFKGEARKPEFLELNPFGGVPLLIHDNLHLSESSAILQQLCEHFQNELRGWYGNGLKEKAAINQLLSWYQGTYRPALSKIMALKFGSVISGNPVKASDLAAAETKMKETLTFLNTLLSKGNTYLVGSNLTIADLLIFHQTTDIQVYKMDLSAYPEVDKWYKKVQQVPQVKSFHTNFRLSIQFSQSMLQQAKITQ